MDNKLLDVLKSLYSSNDDIFTAITNEKEEVLWTNSNIYRENFSANFEKALKQEGTEFPTRIECLIPFESGEDIYTINILPVIQDDEIQGYVLKTVYAKELFRYKYQSKFIADSIKNYRDLKMQVSDMIAISIHVYQMLEEKELYDEAVYFNKIMNNCYKLMRLETNKMEVVQYYSKKTKGSNINLDVFLNETLTIISSILRADGFELVYKSSVEDADAIVNVNPERLVAAIMNLIVNGIKHNISEEKKVTVELKVRGNSAVIDFVDNGLGMDKETIDDIFRKFSDYDLYFNNFKSIGYGYYVVSHFCDTYDSSILIKSKENEGSTVTLKIPLIEGDDKSINNLSSKSAEFITNRFSNLYIYLSEITNMNLYL